MIFQCMRKEFYKELLIQFLEIAYSSLKQHWIDRSAPLRF